MRAEPAGRRALGGAGVLISLGAGFGLLGAGLAACGGRGDSAALEPLRLLHDPPIKELTAQQLRALSMDCEAYPRHQAMRGRYDAAYCEAAMAAWADSPLQMLIIPPAAPPPAGAHTD